MATTTIIISSLILLAAIISQVLPRLERYYKHRPKLIVELQKSNGITSTQTPMGLSSKNKGPVIQVGNPEIWRIYKFEWNFNLIVRNNSEHNAYEVQLLQHNTRPQIRFRENISLNKALREQEEITLPFSIHKITECQDKDRERIFSSKPEFFDDLMIVFNYKNPSGRSFQSRYYFNDDKTTYDRIPLKELTQYWR
ncbi:MAG: hypothetical protein AB3N14_01265 [Flavobacteriaceae bacterium]